jgi:hypothetical protein
MEDTNTVTEYVKPSITDYGNLQDLTAAGASGVVTDVPQGSPCCNVFS